MASGWIWAFGAICAIGLYKCSSDVADYDDRRLDKIATDQRVSNGLTLEQRKAREQALQEAAARKVRKQMAEALVLRFVAEIKGTLNDPDSFRLASAEKMPDGAICFHFRSRNQFNALVPASAVVKPDESVLFSWGRGFKSAWTNHCANQHGVDFSYLAGRL